MPNKINGLLASLAIALAMTSCGGSNLPSPETVLTSYLDASLKNRHEEAYGYLSSEDKAFKSLEAYKAEREEDAPFDEDSPMGKIFLGNIAFNVLEVTETGETAKVDVEMTLPDMEVLFKEMMKAAFGAAMSGRDKEEAQQELIEKYETTEVPTTTRSNTFDLVKEQDGWKVSMGWQAKQANQEKQEQIDTLLSDAQELANAYELTGALAKYQAALALDGERVDIQEAIANTQHAISSLEEKRDYLSKLNFYDFEIKYYGEGKPGVVFKIQNTGERALKEVRVTVYLRDAGNTVIGQETYYPIYATEDASTSLSDPLKPNEIWQVPEGMYYGFSSIPAGWDGRNIVANITNIEFLN